MVENIDSDGSLYSENYAKGDIIQFTTLCLVLSRCP